MSRAFAKYAFATPGIARARRRTRAASRSPQSGRRRPTSARFAAVERRADEAERIVVEEEERAHARGGERGIDGTRIGGCARRLPRVRDHSCRRCRSRRAHQPSLLFGSEWPRSIERVTEVLRQLVVRSPSAKHASPSWRFQRARRVGGRDRARAARDGGASCAPRRMQPRRAHGRRRPRGTSAAAVADRRRARNDGRARQSARRDDGPRARPRPAGDSDGEGCRQSSAYACSRSLSWTNRSSPSGAPRGRGG